MNTYLKYALAGISLLALGACDGGGASTAPDIAGTGKKIIRGPVTGFGSVIVNGVRYDSDDAQIEIDDAPGNLTDLQIGQLVMLEARGTVATMVRYEAELEGPVESVDVANNRFTALGVAVVIEGTTVFSNVTLDTLAPGDFVEVSGEFNANGELHAAFVEREDDSPNAVKIKGTVAALDAAMQRFRLGALIVDYSGATLDPSSLVLANGQFVEVEGQLNNGVLQAAEVELEDRDDDFEVGDEAELEGFVSQVLSATEFVLRGVTVRHSAETEFEDGNAGDIALNVRLEVEGRIDAAGVLIADEIEFDDDERRALRLEFEAPVQSTTASSIRLLGLTLQIRPDTVVRDDRDENSALRVEDIQPGDYVEVRAYRQDDLLIAGRIERDETDDSVKIVGFLDSKDEAANLIVVQGIQVDVSGAEFEDDGRDDFFATVMPGDLVEVSGQFDGNLVIADEVEREDD